MFNVKHKHNISYRNKCFHKFLSFKFLVSNLFDKLDNLIEISVNMQKKLETSTKIRNNNLITLFEKILKYFNQMLNTIEVIFIDCCSLSIR